jgi:hypothetical protein
MSADFGKMSLHAKLQWQLLTSTPSAQQNVNAMAKTTNLKEWF